MLLLEKVFKILLRPTKMNLFFGNLVLGEKRNVGYEDCPKLSFTSNFKRQDEYRLNFCPFSRAKHSNEASLQHYLELTAHIQLLQVSRMTDEIFISNFQTGAPGAVAPGAGRTGCPRTAVEFNRGAT